MKMSKVDNPLGLGKNELEKALEIHNQSIVIDCSNVAIVNPWLDKHLAELFFDKMIEGGVTASNITVPSSATSSTNAGISESAKDFEMHRQWIRTGSDKALLVSRAADIERAKKERRAAIIFGPQGGNIIEQSLDAVKFVHEMGVRVMQLTYNTANFVGDGCMEKRNAGLSNFGMDVVREMNRVGIVVDLSHCGDRTTLEAIEISNKPPIFSHANARVLFNHPRNRTDEQIKALAEKGGVMCVIPYNPFLRSKEGGVVATFKDFLRHVDYVVKLVGVEHVGTATDINENNETRRIWHRQEHPEVVGKPAFHNYPIGFDGDLRKYSTITMALVSGGYSDREISKMLGDNLMRVFKDVWGG